MNESNTDFCSDTTVLNLGQFHFSFLQFASLEKVNSIIVLIFPCESSYFMILKNNCYPFTLFPLDILIGSNK